MIFFTVGYITGLLVGLISVFLGFYVAKKIAEKKEINDLFDNNNNFDNNNIRTKF